MEINATTLVYLRESKRRKNDKGITISLDEQSASRKAVLLYRVLT